MNTNLSESIFQRVKSFTPCDKVLIYYQYYLEVIRKQEKFSRNIIAQTIFLIFQRSRDKEYQ